MTQSKIYTTPVFSNNNTEYSSSYNGSIVSEVSKPRRTMKQLHHQSSDIVETSMETFRDINSVLTSKEKAEDIKLDIKKNSIFTCEICLRSFKAQFTLVRHLKMHSDERPYNCSKCQRKFKHRFHLKAHEQSFHTTERNYLCSKCDKKFKTHAGLKSHQLVHSEAKPFKCTYCTFESKVNYDLIRHRIKTHRIEIPNCCEVCSKGFSDEHELQHHKKVFGHSRDHICVHCSNGFRTIADLEKHQGNTEEEKKFICERCDLSFKVLRCFEEHKKTHVEQKSSNNFSTTNCFEQQKVAITSVPTAKGKNETEIDFLFESTVKNHEEIHSPFFYLNSTSNTVFSKYKCQSCNLNFTQAMGYSTHLAVKHNGVYHPIVCRNRQERNFAIIR